MTLTVEDGTAVSGAESYASVASADAYWGKRTHLALYTTWNAASTAEKEGALREASAYLDATWGTFYRGLRRGYVQGLLWPREGALDDAGYPLPDLPPELASAACELAARALSAPLAADLDRGGVVTRKTEKVGPLEETTQWADGAPVDPRYGAVAGILAPILTGAQPGAGPQWNWR